MIIIAGLATLFQIKVYSIQTLFFKQWIMQPLYKLFIINYIYLVFLSLFYVIVNQML